MLAMNPCSRAGAGQVVFSTRVISQSRLQCQALKYRDSSCHTRLQSCSKWDATSGVLPKATAIWRTARFDHGRCVTGPEAAKRETRRRAEVIRPLTESAHRSRHLPQAAAAAPWRPATGGAVGCAWILIANRNHITYS